MLDKEQNDFSSPQSVSTPAKDSERRYLPRWQVDNKISYKLEEQPQPYECHSRDINSSGVCIRTTQNIPLQQKLDLTVYLAKDIDPVEVRGSVVWKAQRESENWFGVKFDRVSEKTNDLIFKYAFEHKREEVMKNWFKGC